MYFLISKYFANTSSGSFNLARYNIIINEKMIKQKNGK